MSLKLFHVVFVTCSTLLAFLFGGWSLSRGGAGYTAGGIVSFAIGLALVVYGVWFWRKIQTPEEERRKRRKLFRTIEALCGVWLLGAAPEAAHACSACYGRAEGPLMDAAKLGVWLLYGMVVAVQLALVAFFLYLRRRSQQYQGHVDPWWTDVKEAHEP